MHSFVRCRTLQEEFRRRAQVMAEQSGEDEVVYANASNSPIAFSAPQPVHGHLGALVLESDEQRSSTALLELLARARHKADVGGDVAPSFRSLADSLVESLKQRAADGGAAEAEHDLTPNLPPT